MKKEAVHSEELKLCGIDATRKEFTRVDVEKLLEVSEATALKYLDELEAEGRISQMGGRGPNVFYSLKTA
jgi:Fic family protein